MSLQFTWSRMNCKRKTNALVNTPRLTLLLSHPSKMCMKKKQRKLKENKNLKATRRWKVRIVVRVCGYFYYVSLFSLAVWRRRAEWMLMCRWCWLVVHWEWWWNWNLLKDRLRLHWHGIWRILIYKHSLTAAAMSIQREVKKYDHVTEEAQASERYGEEKYLFMSLVLNDIELFI